MATGRTPDIPDSFREYFGASPGVVSGRTVIDDAGRKISFPSHSQELPRESGPLHRYSGTAANRIKYVGGADIKTPHESREAEVREKLALIQELLSSVCLDNLSVRDAKILDHTQKLLVGLTYADDRGQRSRQREDARHFDRDAFAASGPDVDTSKREGDSPVTSD